MTYGDQEKEEIPNTQRASDGNSGNFTKKKRVTIALGQLGDIIYVGDKTEGGDSLNVKFPPAPES